VGEGLWHAGRCSKSRSHARDLYGLTARQGDTRRDSVDPLDGSAPDRWVLCPGLRRGHRPGRVPRSTSVSGWPACHGRPRSRAGQGRARPCAAVAVLCVPCFSRAMDRRLAFSS